MQTLEARKGAQCVRVTLDELIQQANYVNQLSFTKLRLNSTQAGQHLSRHFGRGMEYAESRRYQTGDDIRTIDWKVTARTQKTHTKLFSAEKERQVLLCIDLRSPMFFATKGVFKSVQAALLGSCLGWRSVHNGDRLGGIVFTDSSTNEFKPALGKRGLLPICHCLADQFNKDIELTQSPTMENALKALDQVATTGGLISIISDFRGLTQPAKDLLIKISRRSDINLCFIYDKFERSLPKNSSLPLTNGLSEIFLNTGNKSVMDKHHQMFLERYNNVKSLEKYSRINFVECSTEDDYLSILHK